MNDTAAALRHTACTLCCGLLFAWGQTACAASNVRPTAAAHIAAGELTEIEQHVPVEASTVLKRVLRDNSIFLAHHDRDYFEKFRDQQKPSITLVGCADARFQPGDLDQTPDGELFTVRNIGNQVDLNEGSVEYGVRHLHTPVLLIVGHVSCGAVRAVLEDYSQESPALRRELNGLHLSVRRTNPDLPLEARWREGVLQNVHQQVQDARQTYAAEVQAGKLTVVGAVYDFRNDLGRGTGRLIIVNINGKVEFTYR